MRSGCATTPRVPPDREQTRNRKALSTVSSYRSLLQINLALGRSEIPLAVTLHQAPSVLRSMVDTLFFEMARLKSTASERQRTEQQQQPHSLEKQRSEESAAQTESRPINGTQESATQTESLPVDSGQPVRIVHDPTDRQDALLLDQLRHENRLLAESLREMSSESTRLLLQLKSVQQQLADQDSGSIVRANAALERIRELRADVCSLGATEHAGALGSSPAVRRATSTIAHPVDASLALLMEELAWLTTEFRTYRSQVSRGLAASRRHVTPPCLFGAMWRDFSRWS